MNLLCWNCRGMGSSRSVRQLRKWSSTYAPDIVFVSETMVKKNVAENLKEKLGYAHTFGVASRGKERDLCMFWREEVEFTLISFSQNHICGDISHNGARSWRFVGIYGCPREEDKHKSWKLLRHLCEEVDIPIIF